MAMGISSPHRLYKMNEPITYDTAIIGGGLAGLSAAIVLADKGHKVVLFEKEAYPYHKVCGEYISMESKPFLQELGIPFESLQLPFINKLIVSAPDGSLLQQPLSLGGFGISRYKLDDMLKDIALQKAVTILQRTKVNDVEFDGKQFVITTATQTFYSKTCCGAFGKKANLDVKWNRPFSRIEARKLNKYMGVKYHIQTDFPEDTIALHNFENGYCGISKIEDDRYCLCYLTHVSNLENNQHSIEQMEAVVLKANPHLEKILNNSVILYKNPVSIAQISFMKKSQIENHVLLLGDAAGLITPLCGNGMSMALHSAKIAAACIDDFLQEKISRQQLEKKYARQWKKNFATRLWFGRMIQRFFGKSAVTNRFVANMRMAPGLTRWLIKKTHGKPF